MSHEPRVASHEQEAQGIAAEPQSHKSIYFPLRRAQRPRRPPSPFLQQGYRPRAEACDLLASLCVLTLVPH